MLKQADTPQAIAAQSGAALGDVHDFINAYHAIGYIESDAQASPAAAPRRGTLLERLRGAHAS